MEMEDICCIQDRESDQYFRHESDSLWTISKVNYVLVTSFTAAEVFDMFEVEQLESVSCDNNIKCLYTIAVAE